ncbi:hypothetical protein [Microbulbifer sp. TYP-18]|uniref:hypothetical protein n=1 Tax=Microbulbifer sp. TYP-18 TaxID=3230024 RepID=UPI0034C6B9DC
MAINAQSSLAATTDMPVSDPATLRAMGFEPDAGNVYVAAGVDLTGTRIDLESDTSVNRDLAVHPNLFPSGSVDYSPVAPKEFFGRVDSTGTQWRFSSGGSTEISRLGTEAFADAQVEDLPNGGVLQFFRWWWSDNDPSSAMTAFLFEICQPAFAGGAITFTTVATSTSTDTLTGSAAISTASRPIDTQSCYYLVRVRFDAATALLRFQKARLQFTHP